MCRWTSFVTVFRSIQFFIKIKGYGYGSGLLLSRDSQRTDGRGDHLCPFEYPSPSTVDRLQETQGYSTLFDSDGTSRTFSC